MKILVAVETALSILQLLICGFSLSFLISVVARILFLAKLLGMRIKLSVTTVMELASVFVLLLIPVIFKSRISWLSVVVTLLIALVSITLAWYDDHFYVYTEETINAKER